MDQLHPVSPTVSPLSQSPAARLDQNGSASEEPPRKKTKRNKPTLSCEECVERKTKCDRGRPNCLACIKRQTECRYAHMANVLEESHKSKENGRRMTKPPKKRLSVLDQTKGQDLVASAIKMQEQNLRRDSNSSTGALLSNVPYSHPSASNVFGIGSEHPFANYWTHQGGLPEVISVLPERVQADILMERYFECVDPIYPMIHRQHFYADYEQFWSLPQQEKDQVDGTLIALIFSMLAMGTQFVPLNHPTSRQQTAEFYVSAAHQALRMSSYMNRATIRSIQAMVLITYFLINDNHASDGWAFAGILIRQAYAIGLHRDPNIVCPDATIFEKQQRRKLWQAVFLQDTFLTVLLSLPPSATHTDVSVELLIETPTSCIAAENPSDTPYIRGSWNLANLVQESICSPRSLDLPICTSSRQKSKLLADFRAVYRSLPDAFRSWTAESLQHTAQTNRRLVKQTLFLTSNYFHNVMLLHSSEWRDPSAPEKSTAYQGSPNTPVGTTPAEISPTLAAFPGLPHRTGSASGARKTRADGQETKKPAVVQKNIRGTLEAAHDAINSFFLFVQIFAAEARVWWVFNHRAFLEALCIAEVLRECEATGEGEGAGSEGSLGGLFVKARDDVVHMIDIMRSWSETGYGCEVARTRVSVLSKYL